MPSRSRSLKRNSRSVRRSRTLRGPSFAAKLGAFLLEGAKGKVQFTEKGGFSAAVPEVFGVLPYLHLNMSEASFRKNLSDNHSNRVNSLSKVCKSKNLEKRLSKVNFNCRRTVTRSIEALDQAVVDSINNSWNIRNNGRKYLLEVLKNQRYQVKKGIIPASSVAWGLGL
jgi:hypothetical protein